MRPLLAAAILSATPAHAEDLDELVVTAQRRPQAQTEVGISMTIVGSEEIARRQWRTSEDIAERTPGLVVRSFSGGSSIGLFSIRGVAQNDFTDHQEAPVAVYVDQAYQPFTGGATIELFDIERIEILRGPQGTLYGRNATGGLVNIVTRKPTATFEGSASATLESYGGRRIEAALSGPITPWLRARVAGLTDHSDGYFHVPDSARAPAPAKLFGGLPRIGGTAINGSLRNRSRRNIRVRLEADPLPNLTIGYSFAAARVQRERNGYDTLPAPAGRIDRGASDFFGTPFDPRPLRENPDLIGYVDKHADSHQLSAALTRGRWQVDALGSIGSLSKSYLEDDDGGPFAIGLFGTDQRARHRTAELRASGPLGKATLTGGLYLMRRIGSQFATFQFPAITGASGAGIEDGFGIGYDADYRLTTRAEALFGQVELPLADRLRVIAGLRWTRERQRFAITVRCVDDPASSLQGCANGGISPGSVAAQGPTSLRQSDNLYSGKLQLEYAPRPGGLIWLSYSRGVKGGGYTVPLDGIQTADKLPYRPETLHAFELGARFASRGISWSASAFTYLYRSYQGFVIDGPTTVIGNFPARIHGAEIEAEMMLPGRLHLTTGLSVLRARVRDVQVSPGVLATQHMSLAPPFTATAALYRDFTLSPNMTLQVSVNSQYTGSMYFNTINGPLVRARGYAIANAGLTLHFPLAGTRASIGLIARNIFDAKPVTYSFDLSTFFGNVLRVHGPPRVLGLTSSIEF